MREIENGERKTGIWYVIDFTDTFNGRILKYILDVSWEFVSVYDDIIYRGICSIFSL